MSERVLQFCPVCGEKFVTEVLGGLPRLRCPACRFIYFRNPAPIVHTLVMDQDRYLICRRSQNVLGPGWWCLPGGYVELDEDFLTAAVREVKEEANVDVEISAILKVSSDVEKNVLNIMLLGKLLSGEAKPDGYEIDLVKWFAASEEVPWLGSGTAIVRSYLDGKASLIPIDGATPHL